MFMSITYLSLICLFVCSFVHSSDGSVRLSIYLSLSLLSFSPNFSFSRPTKMWSKIFFLDISMRVYLTEVILTWKLVFLLWNCFIFNQNRNVTCEKKYEGLDRRGSALFQLMLYPIFLFLMKMNCTNSTSDHMNFAWPSIIFHNTLTQMRNSIFLLVMVFLDWWTSRFKASIALVSSTNAGLNTLMG